jgi:hypothetical protein
LKLINYLVNINCTAQYSQWSDQDGGARYR